MIGLGAPVIDRTKKNKGLAHYWANPLLID